MIDADAIPTVKSLTDLQIDTVDRWHREPIDNPHDGLESLVCQQHQFNYRLWHEEDKARDPSATDAKIAEVKRSIDKLNQARNDMIEKIDDAITAMLDAAGIQAADAAVNTETAGSAIDRLSIMSLRLFHYAEQRDRAGADDTHRAKVAQRITLCQQQHADLSNSLQELFDDIFAGRKQHRTYRQMKMYNDPSLNPAIYKANSADS